MARIISSRSKSGKRNKKKQEYVRSLTLFQFFRIINSNRTDNESSSSSSSKPDTTPVMIIGNNNVFEVDCSSHALKIGDNNILESKCRVGRSARLSNGCIVGAACALETGETLEENTVVFGVDARRRRQMEKPAPQTLQIDFLSKVLPNYHHLKKPTKK